MEGGICYTQAKYAGGLETLKGWNSEMECGQTLFQSYSVEGPVNTTAMQKNNSVDECVFVNASDSIVDEMPGSGLAYALWVN